MPAKNLLIAWFNYFTTFFSLKFFAVVIGEPRRKGTSWRGWRKRRDRLTRDHRAFGWTRSDGPSGEYLWVQNSVNSTLYTHTHTHTCESYTHILVCPFGVWRCRIMAWVRDEPGTGYQPNIQGKKILFPYVTQVIELLNFSSHFEI